MSGKGNCYDNAMVETFFKTLKSELVWRTIFLTRAQAAGAIGRYIASFYNPRPPSLDAGLRQPGRVRKTGHNVSRRLFTKAGQVHNVGGSLSRGQTRNTSRATVQSLSLIPVSIAGLQTGRYESAQLGPDRPALHA